MVTLSDVFFMEQLNDTAFVMDDKLIVLIEHQSTINENIALRMLLYVAREYEMITESENLYKRNRVQIPTPEFIVLYNGKEEFPEYKEIKLSDSFKVQSDAFLELVVKVYNINKGCNADIAARSPTLSGYSELVAEMNKNLENGMSRSVAAKATIKSCMDRQILLSFLKEHCSEVFNMLLTEWNTEDALRVRYEEGVIFCYP